MRTFLGIAMAMSAAVWAQDIKELEGHMKATGKVMQTMKKCDAESAVAAKKVSEDYKAVATWFKQKGMADAVKWSEDASVAAADLAKHAGAGAQEPAMASFQKLAGTCRSCHEVHREKLPDGTYKLK